MTILGHLSRAKFLKAGESEKFGSQLMGCGGDGAVQKHGDSPSQSKTSIAPSEQVLAEGNANKNTSSTTATSGEQTRSSSCEATRAQPPNVRRSPSPGQLVDDAKGGE